MFPAETSSAMHATRSKRTRQAAGNDDSVKLPLTKKRRSALRRDTFEPLSNVSVNEVAGRDSTEARSNGHTNELAKPQHARSTSQSRELTLRGAKKTEKRGDKGAGLLTLSSNSFYVVAQLPSLPDQIRTRPSVPYSCVISPDNEYILALTHTDALIWPYNSSSTVPSTRDLISFKLPFPPANVTDPLPLAAFTAKSANGEPGIVAVSPKWGKAVYWDSIANASSFVPGQPTHGVQGSIPGMLNGEVVKELVKAEPAGYILTFNHGRVAHLTVRDQMGRPGIGVQFMRKSAASSVRGGIFGSIRSVFGGDRRKGTPIVRAGKSAKAQRDVVVGTEDGEFEFWNTNLSVGNTLMKTIDLKDEIEEALKPFIGNGTVAHQRILDFELVTTPASGHDIAKRGDADSLPLILLVSSSVDQETRYYLIESVVSNETVHIKTVHPVRCYSSAESSAWRPRLCIPTRQPIAFVLFERAVVFMSLARFRETPTSQLLAEKAGPPERFQDCVQFQDDSVYKVLGYASEFVEKHAACLLAVQGFGIVRIVSCLEDDVEIDVEDMESRVGPKTKIEQAIFFGTIRQNPLELSKPATFAPDEIENAALEISDEILSSTSKYLPKSAPSVEQQMKLRSKALEDLAHHALKHYASAISRKTRFLLLFNGEKMAAAQAIWKVQQKIQSTYPRKDDREFSYLQFVLRALHESRQKYPDKEKGEIDHVRHWLLNSVPQIDHLMTELTGSLNELEDMDVRDPRIVCDYLVEAVRVWTATYETAFKFREDNAPLYGLGDEVFAEGVLQTAYPSGLDFPWTSGPESFRYGQRLIYDISSFLVHWWDYSPTANGKTKGKKTREMPEDLEGNPYDAPSKDAMKDLASRLRAEVDLFVRITYEENSQARALVRQSEDDVETQEKKIAKIKDEVRPRITQAIKLISNFDMPGAISLGEKLEDPGLLVDLNMSYLRQLKQKADAHPETTDLYERTITEVQDHTETYFERFGHGWAYACFSSKIMYGEIGSLLAEAQTNQQKQKYATWFFKTANKQGQQLEKLSWINEIVGEERYDVAQKTLEKIAVEEETDVWAKKTELCLAKLAGLAAQELAEETSQGAPSDLSKNYEDSLAVLELQESVVSHITASVSDAIDDKAARDLAIDTFAKRVVDKTPALKRLLIATIDSVLSNQTLTPLSATSLLTLMDPVSFAGLPDDDPGVQGREFGLALQLIDLSSSSVSPTGTQLSDTELDGLRMLTWRRAMIRDDWSLLNATTGKSDRQVVDEMQMSSLFKTMLEVFQLHYDVQDPALNASRVSPILFSPQQILEASGQLSENLQTSYLDAVGADGNTTEGKKFLDQLQRDIDVEQAKLRKFVEKAQMEKHWEGLVKEAERVVREWVDSRDLVEETVQTDDDIRESIEINGS